MSNERTLSIIKPDAVAKNVIGQIYARFEGAGLKVIAAKMTRNELLSVDISAPQTRGCVLQAWTPPPSSRRPREVEIHLLNTAAPRRSLCDRHQRDDDRPRGGQQDVADGIRNRVAQNGKLTLRLVLDGAQRGGHRACPRASAKENQRVHFEDVSAEKNRHGVWEYRRYEAHENETDA